MNSTVPVHPENIQMPHDQRDALLQRVLSSHGFQKAPKLQEFLAYVCDCAFRGKALNEVKEQQIAVHVFHRPPDYNMSEDSIVRVQARELRKRLSTYFETEGKSEPYVISIPKGGYLPFFVPAGRISHAEHESETSHIPETDNALGRIANAGRIGPAPRRVIQWIAAMFGSLLLFVAGWLTSTQIWQPRPSSAGILPGIQASSMYKQLLGPLGLNNNDTLLVLSNPKVLLYSSTDDPGIADLKGKSFVLVPPELREGLASARNLGEDPGNPIYLSTENTGYTGIGEAASAYNVGQLMFSLGRSVRLTQGRFLNWDAAMKENLIVLGNPDINAWTHSNLLSSNFVFTRNGIHNSKPLPGEKADYKTFSDSSGLQAEDYGLIHKSTPASGSKFLTLAGRTSPGTQGTGDFFTNPDKMRQAFERLNALKGSKPFPENWEILIHISVRDDFPVETKLVTVRITDPDR